MFATMTSGVAARVRQFHEDERGDVMQNICVGGVGALGCSMIFYIFKNVILPLLMDKLKGLLGGNMLAGANGLGGAANGAGETGGTLPTP